MNTLIQDIVLRLHTLRPNSSQFLFLNTIYPVSTLEVRKAIIEFKKDNSAVEEIDFIMNSPGGLADDAYRIIRTLRSNFKIVNVIVPFWAKSAATLLSLGANRIIMDEFGEFGALDAQLVRPREDSPEYDSESALNDEHSISVIENRFKIMYEQMYIRLYEHNKINMPKGVVSEQLLYNLSKFFKPLLSQIDPYKLGEKKRKLDIGSQYASRILLQYGSAKNPEAVRSLVHYLISECPDHGYVVDKSILEFFLANVYPSSYLGDDYKTTLQELSCALLEADHSQLNFIGFVLPVKLPVPGENIVKEESGKKIDQDIPKENDGAALQN